MTDLVVVRQRRKRDLLDVTLTLGAPRRLTSHLDRRQQERDQHADNRDHD
jgi:hypothetical protein